MTAPRADADPQAAWRPTATPDTLRRRAELLARTRRFFADRDVLEVDTPVLQGGANLDPGVHPFRVETPDGPRFLPTSPEHPLKRLVAAGHGPVWTLAPAFRRGERGRRHLPEFRMLEWYRPDWDDRRLLGEVLDLLDHLTGWGTGHEVIAYRDAFRTHLGIDPLDATDAALANLLGPDATAVQGDRAAACDLLLATRIEPHLGRGTFTVITGYPPHLAAQARLRPAADGRPAAARFEIYRDGIELANGYWELTDATELADRLGSELARRDPAHGIQRDQRFEHAIAAGFPACAGVAVGFDRVVMLALGLPDIREVVAFPWPWG
jgi:lysyl-tRNA synthetase class 2